MCPKRVVRLGMERASRFAVASDAAQEDGGRPSGGFLAETNGGSRRGALVYCTLCLSLRRGDGPKIAQLELLQVVAGLTIMPEVFRAASGVWFIDSLAALYALVKGRSDSPELDHMASIVHSLLFGLDCCMFFEWIESKKATGQTHSQEMVTETRGIWPTAFACTTQASLFFCWTCHGRP
jgi:hypothetical protein